MHHDVPSLRSRTRRAAVSAGLAILLSLAAACGSSGPQTPDELLEAFRSAITTGRIRDAWPLLTEDHRRAFTDQVIDLRRTIARNPGAVGLVKQFNCTVEEFATLPPVDLWVRHHEGKEQGLDGARIVDRHEDPQQPGDLIVDVENVYGARFRWVVRPVPSGGVGLQHAMMIRSADQAAPAEDGE